MIRNIIVEGADQQGKTTVCHILSKMTGWGIKHFGLPIPEDFDWHDDYILPECTISDRNFLSEIVYSKIRGEHHRVRRLEELQNKMIAKGYVLILADRWEHFVYDIFRKEAFTEREIREVRRLYREAFKDIRIAKLQVNPSNEPELQHLTMLVGRNSKILFGRL